MAPRTQKKPRDDLQQSITNYGHCASRYKQTQKFRKCGENHPNIDSWQNTEARCASCNRNYYPWSFECLERI